MFNEAPRVALDAVALGFGGKDEWHTFYLASTVPPSEMPFIESSDDETPCQTKGKRRRITILDHFAPEQEFKNRKEPNEPLNKPTCNQATVPRTTQKKTAKVGHSSSTNNHEELLLQYDRFFKERGLAIPSLSLEPESNQDWKSFVRLQASRKPKKLGVGLGPMKKKTLEEEERRDDT